MSSASHPFVDLAYPKTIHNLQEAFENGKAIAGPDTPCLGERKLLSKDPVKWADSFEWQTWKVVDERRHAFGSGLYKMFQDGVIGGGELRTVGIWSRNTPSKPSLSMPSKVLIAERDKIVHRLATYRAWLSLVQPCDGSVIRHIRPGRSRCVATVVF